MQLFISSLNSGSNGNCYYVGNEREAVLVDVGISCRETEKRMHRQGLSMHKVKAVFISHEHSDHIRGVEVLARKYQLPVYITPGTHFNTRADFSRLQILTFTAHEPVQIGELQITAFPKLHDARDPHSFIVAYKNVKVGVFTDIGAPCEHVTTYFKQCHAVFLEANYDDDMLERGHYPFYLKNRIRGNYGHLSNKQALELFREHRSPELSHVLLSHLSKDNNCPELLKNYFEPHAEGTEIIVASRYYETPVYTISSSEVLQFLATENEAVL